MFAEQQAMELQQQVAAQAMTATLAGSRYSEASESGHGVTGLGEDGDLLRARNREPLRGSALGAVPSGKWTSPHPTNHTPRERASPRAGAAGAAAAANMAGSVPAASFAAQMGGPEMGAAAQQPRYSRRSDQSRRSERAYGRGSGASVELRGSVISGGGGADDDFLDDSSGDMDGMDWEVADRGKPWYRRRRVWRLLPLALSVVFILSGALYLVYGSGKMIKDLQIWRLSFFLAGLPVIWWVGDWVTRGIVWGVERSLFRVQNALYFAYAVRKPLANVLRAVLSLGFWALMMTVHTQNQTQSVRNAIRIVLRIWACVTLCMTANLIKTLLAKLLASKFNKESHLRKMHDSLVKEYYIHMLLQPRHREAGGGEGDGGAGSPQQQKQHGGSGGGSGGAEEPGGGGGDGGGHLGSSFASAFRRLFTRESRPAEELSTVSEELLEEGEAPSATVAIQVDVTASGTAQHSVPPPELPGGKAGGQAPPGHPDARGSAYTQRSRLTSLDAAAAALNKTQSLAGQRRSSWMRDTGISLQPAAAGPARTLQRSAALQSRRLQRGGGSKLEPVLEGSESGRLRALTANQLTKMETYIRRNALQVTFRDELSATERREAVRSEAEARKLAFYLFWNVKADLERPCILLDDMRDFLPGEGEAETAFAMLNSDGGETVTLQDCIAAMLRLYEERRDLALSLKDTKSVVGKLENVIGVAVHIVFVFFYLWVFNVDVIKTYVALSSLVLAFSFIFQNSIRTMYENVVFLFAVHPFDVGDVLQLDSGDMYRVDEIDLQYTILIAGSGARTWYPNQKLMASAFANVSASGERWDGIKAVVDMDTPVGVIEAVRAACEGAAATVPGELGDSVSVNLRDTAAPLKVTLVVGFKYTHNGADQGRCANARTLMHVTLCETLTQLGVQYTIDPSVRTRAAWAPAGGAGRPPAGGGDLDGAGKKGV